MENSHNSDLAKWPWWVEKNILVYDGGYIGLSPSVIWNRDTLHCTEFLWLKFCLFGEAEGKILCRSDFMLPTLLFVEKMKSTKEIKVDKGWQGGEVNSGQILGDAICERSLNDCILGKYMKNVYPLDLWKGTCGYFDIQYIDNKHGMWYINLVCFS